jgi:hypothetical protein
LLLQKLLVPQVPLPDWKPAVALVSHVNAAADKKAGTNATTAKIPPDNPRQRNDI